MDVEEILLNNDSENENPIKALIRLLSTPIAKRKGVFINTEDCGMWVEELEKYLNERG